jgi:tetratricopeptide (TPR) repeat protein
VSTGTAVALILLTTAPAGAAPVAGAALVEGRRLAAVYDSILAAEFERVQTQLRDTCPPAPDTACRSLEAMSIWWQILIDPENRALDKALNQAAASAIESATSWTQREPSRAEAWFYLAGANAPLVQWRVLRGERLSAAREASRVKSALERALQLDPSLGDAYFGIGLYHYYAAVAPTYAKFIRFILLLPGGDRRLGLREMLEARDRGELLRGEADYQLHQIYLWYENKPREALELLRSLDERYPSNPIFLRRMAEVNETHFHDPRAAAASWRELLVRAQAGRVYEAGVTAVRARLGLAAALIAMNDIDAALAELQIVIDAHPIAPSDAVSRAEALVRTLRARKQ